MTAVAEVVVISVAMIIAVVFFAGEPPSADQIANRCIERGRVAQVVVPVTRPNSAVVVCRDGTVHRVKP